jgi:hypothetical protein
MAMAGTTTPWSSRLLLVLCLALSFLVPYAGTVLAERVLIARWEKFGFSPDQTLAWWDSGVLSMKTAKDWRRNGFLPEEIRSWQAMDFPPDEASEWRDARADVAVAAEWRRYAFAPERAAHWMQLQFTVGDAIAWRKHGFAAEEAAGWRDKGMSPTGAAQAKRSRKHP